MCVKFGQMQRKSDSAPCRKTSTILIGRARSDLSSAPKRWRFSAMFSAASKTATNIRLRLGANGDTSCLWCLFLQMPCSKLQSKFSGCVWKDRRLLPDWICSFLAAHSCKILLLTQVRLLPFPAIFLWLPSTMAWGAIDADQIFDGEIPEGQRVTWPQFFE